MNRLRRPLGSASSYTNTISSNNDNLCSSNELKLERVLKDITFLRINIDSIAFPETNGTIERLIQNRALFGFTLDYRFPCLDGISSSLKTRVRINAKSFSSTEIVFKHKRVVLIKMSPEMIPFWQRTELYLSLSIQIDTHGKFASRHFADCHVPLGDLVIPPFMVSRDIPFLGKDFEGYGLVRVDLGSKNKMLMEKIEDMRGIETPIMDGKHFVVPSCAPFRARSRSTSRCHSRSEKSKSPPPRRTNSVTSLPPSLRSHSSGSDDVFSTHESHVPRVLSRREDLFDITSTMGQDVVEITPGSARKSVVKLTIHEASDLPPIVDEHGHSRPPSSFVSVRGRDGELRSLTIQGTRPRWEWSAQFAISSERKNLVVKVLHSDGIHADKPLGFVSLSLPIQPTSSSSYELVDLTGIAHTRVATITLSVESIPDRIPSIIEMRSDTMKREHMSKGGRRERRSHDTSISGSSALGETFTMRRRTPSPEIEETREEIERRLRKNLNELDHLISQIPRC